MKVVVLNGSPKGELGVTLQYMKYIQKNFQANEYKVYNIGKEIKKIEREKKYFDEIIEEVEKSDAIVWLTPVYFLLVPSQLKKFIELVFENNFQDSFKCKYSTVLTTSVKYFDHLAHNYLRAVSEDMKMNYVDGFTAEMEDLLNSSKRELILKFWKNFDNFVVEKLPAEKRFNAQMDMGFIYNPAVTEETAKAQNKKILLLSDAKEEDLNLNRMIEIFVKLLPNKIEVIDINKTDIKGGCLSCYNCAKDNICVHKDDFSELNKKLIDSDAVIIAGKIKDRFLSSRWKMFFDRLFVNGHAPVINGKQFAYIISGPLRQNSDLLHWISAFVQGSISNLAGVVTDEYEDSDYITTLLKNLGRQIMRGIDEKYIMPENFLGVGGHLLFSDFIYDMRWFFRADHRYYKKHGLYCSSYKKHRNKIQNFIMSCLTAFPGMRKEIYKKAHSEMIKVFDKYNKEV